MDENIEMLRSIAPDASEERIRAALKKHPNDLNAAVTALLDQVDIPTSGDEPMIGPLLGPMEAPFPEDEQFTRGRGALNAKATGRRNNSPIAIEVTKASPESSTIGLASSSFLDSTQDSSKWAVVHQPQAASAGVQYGPHLPPDHPQYPRSQQQQDEDLSLAMAASLRSSMLESGGNVPFVELSMLQNIRPTPDFPVTVRSRTDQFLHVGPLVQALYNIPQIREAFRGVVPRVHTNGNFTTPFWRAMSRMEMGTQSDVLIEDVIPNFHHNPDGNSIITDVKALAEEMYKNFASEVRSLPEPFSQNLLYSKIWYPPTSGFGSGGQTWNNPTNPYARETDTSANLPLIPISANVNSPENDLLTYLHEHTWSRKLASAGEVLVFEIAHDDGLVPISSVVNAAAASTSKGTGATNSKTTTGPNQKYILRFPARLYVDPFLLENAEIAVEQRTIRFQLERSIQESESQLSALGGGNNKSPLKNLRASIKYYEELAVDSDDDLDGEKRKSVLAMLKQALQTIENQIEVHKERIKQTRDEIAGIYNITALQKIPYDLCSVLMWDGVYGRTHLYAYIKAIDGKWYKSVESTITEVTEEAVINDATGLHLGAGPFMLFYSKVSPPSSLIAEEPMILDSTSPTQASYDQAEQGVPPVDTTKEVTPPNPKENERNFEVRKVEFSRWHPLVRKEVKMLNAQFRTALEENGLLDAEGRILQAHSTEATSGKDKTGEDGKQESTTERFMWEDTLARWEDEEIEGTMQYDSDAQEIDEGENDRAAGDEDDEILTKPWVTHSQIARQPSENVVMSENNDTPLNWHYDSNAPRSWEEAGWGAAANPIEVEVTRTVETKQNEEGAGVNDEK